MLPKKERLSRHAFDHFFSIGRRLNTASFQLVYHPHETLHVSVVVPKKILSSAVQRNKIRRQMYDIVRNYKKACTINGVYIFICKAPTRTMSYHELKNEIQSAIHNTLSQSGKK